MRLMQRQYHATTDKCARCRHATDQAPESAGPVSSSFRQRDCPWAGSGARRREKAAAPTTLACLLDHGELFLRRFPLVSEVIELTLGHGLGEVQPLSRRVDERDAIG